MSTDVAGNIGQSALVGRLLDRLKPRGKSLIVTVFGDAILPHGGGTWLGDLIKLLGPLGLAERMVRTSVFRLAQDGLLTATPFGRRSFYALTTTGARQFHAASRRIYAVRDATWDGTWTQVWLSDEISGDALGTLRRELGWLGFTVLARNLMAFAGAEHEAAETVIDGLGLTSFASVLTAREVSGHKTSVKARALVDQTWPLDDIGAGHQSFIAAFQPVHAALISGELAHSGEYFALRTLLVHDYRRVVLRDPMLPADLLPEQWPGLRAAALARAIYRIIAEPAQRHVMANLEDLNGPFGPPSPGFDARFGGLAV